MSNLHCISMRRLMLGINSYLRTENMFSERDHNHFNKCFILNSHTPSSTFIVFISKIAAKKKDLKKKLRVSFEGEPGLDLGGLTKEWFLLLIRKIFREEYGNCLH